MTAKCGQLEDPPIPRFHTKKKTKVAYELNTSVFSDWVGSRVDMDVIKIFVRGIQEYFKFDSCDLVTHTAIVDTLSLYMNEELTNFLAQKICLQLAWNIDYIKDGNTIPEIISITEPTWLPFQIIEFSLVPSNDSLVRASFLAFAGRQAGYTFSRVMPFRYLRYFAYQIGFSRKYQYDDNPGDLIGLRFIGLAVPDENGFDIVRFSLNQSISKRNKKIIKNRIGERNYNE